MLKEFCDMEEEIENSNTKWKFKLYIKQCYLIVWGAGKIQKKRPKVERTKNGRIMLLSKFAVCNSKILKSLKGQEAQGLLSNMIGVKVPFLIDLPELNTFF